MSWLSSAWGWYATNSGKVNPIVAGLGGAALVWAAITQARTATNRHYEQTRADQERRLTESFSKAVEQLAGDKVEARLGGIYTLERLAREAIAHRRLASSQRWPRLRRNRTGGADPASDLYWTVMETLTAFVRERARWKELKPTASEMTPKSDMWQSGARSDDGPGPATDIAAVLAVIVRRDKKSQQRERDKGWRLDFRETDLRRANLHEAPLYEANLSGAHLERAILRGAYLEGGILRGAHLEDAQLLEAHLGNAQLQDAHLEGAYLAGAQLKNAGLGGAYLKGAQLQNAHLEGAKFEGAHLEGAKFEGAYLVGVDLHGATGDAKTRLPDGVPRPDHWPPYEP